MKIKAVFLFALTLSVLYVQEIKAGGEPIQNQYSFCNLYIGTLCIGVERGDEVVMSLPVDFLLYQLKLHFGGTASFYYGLHPADLERSAVITKTTCLEGYEKCKLYKIGAQTYRFMFQQNAESDVFDAYFYDVSELNLSAYIEFLSNFHSCSVKELSLDCEETSLFSNLSFD